MITVNRRYRFSASHRLHAATLTSAQNAALYGKCNNPYGHGHDYILEVGCDGPLDRTTGLLLPIPSLDRLVDAEVLRHFSGKNINLDVAAFAHLVPTTENIARVITDLLEQAWSKYVDGPARLARVHVQETDRNGFEILTGTRSSVRQPEPEEITHA